MLMRLADTSDRQKLTVSVSKCEVILNQRAFGKGKDILFLFGRLRLIWWSVQDRITLEQITVREKKYKQSNMHNHIVFFSIVVC